ncbi:MAG: hypothetical protein IKW45_07340 [Clostridia bacterium]|nr:hypothetical protein [Clostridia bacterium]
MNKAIVKFSSVTYALKAKGIVENYGGKAIIRKNKQATATEGCGYNLIIIGNVGQFINLFDLNRVKYIRYEMIE